MGSTMWRRLGYLGIASLVGWATLSMGTMPALAQRCTADCGSGQIQFTPGDRITVRVMNRSTTTVGIEQPPITGPRTLQPGEDLELGFGWGTTPNISILFWALRDQPIRVKLGRPAAQTLSMELYSVPSEPSHRSIFIENDGRVSIK